MTPGAGEQVPDIGVIPGADPLAIVGALLGLAEEGM